MQIRFAIALALLVPFAARAAGTEALLQGSGLAIDAPCARHVTIDPDPSLHGAASIQVTADHQEEIDRLILRSRGNVELLTRPGGCWNPDFRGAPTMDITIRVPAGYPVAVDEAGAGSYTIGAVAGRLKLDVSGAADIVAADAADLSIDISGSGSVAVAQAAGVASVSISGHGHVSLSQGTLPSLTADLSGAGALSVLAGQIGKLSVDDSGAGSIQIGATVGDARLDISGIGSVRLAKVTGSLQKDVSGVGSVTIGD